METGGAGAPVCLLVERHTFESRVRVSPQRGDHRPAVSRVIVDEPSLYFATVQLEFFKTQRTESLSDTVLAGFPKRPYDSEDWTEWDVSTILKGRNRKAQLMLIDGFDPAVFASKDIVKDEIVGLFASELVEEVTLPRDVDDSRDAIWLVALVCPRSLYKGPPLHFSSIRGGNCFRFMRHCRAGDQTRAANTSLDVVWMQSRPYLVVRASCAIASGAELLYDWGDEFLAKLQAFDLGWAAIASHALHQRISDLSAALLASSGTLPPWERPVGGVDITFDASGGRARVLLDDPLAATPMELRTEARPPRPEPVTKRRGRERDVGLVGVTRDDVFEYAHAEFIAKLQPETNRCKRALASIMDKTKLPDEWQAVIKRDFHDRAFELIHSDAVGDLSMRRIDLLAHHVMWNNPPCRTHFGVVADAPMPQGCPLLVYK